MEYLFLCYKSCSTCAKAKKILTEKNINFTYREISKENPTLQELSKWIKQSDLPIKKFFNTSGKVYRDLKLKDKLDDMSDDEKIKILASDGMLVKRPLLIADSKILVGFKEVEYQELI